MKSLLTLIPYFKKYKLLIGIGLLFIVMSNIFGIVIPPIVRESIDGILLMLQDNKEPAYIDRIPEWFRTGGKIALIPGLIILGAAMIKGVFLYFTRQTLIVVSRYIEFDLKNSIFKHYQNLGQSFYSANYTGDLMNRITEDVSKVRSFAGPAVMYSINLSIMIAMVVSLMFYVNVKITLYVLIPLPFLTFIIYRVSDAMNKQSDIIQGKLSDITSYAQETFSGVQILKSYAAEKNFSGSFKKLNKEFLGDNMKLVHINALFMPTVIGVVGLSVLLTIYVGGKEAIAGNFTLGNIVEYVIYVNMLTWPVASLGYVTSLVQQGAASMARINEFLGTEVESDNGGLEINKLDASIEFKNVSFRYPNTDVDVLKNVSFSIPKGSKFGIIGTTGSGKSTIAKLLMQVYDITEGQILIDGKDIKAYSKASLRGLVGYVAQDIFLFSETIRDNILFGSEIPRSDQEVDRVLEIANLSREIEGFEDGLDTILGERGITLSGGQKQRTAIARALIKQPNILLIDDGLSAVDTKTEVDIKNSIKEVIGEQTFINISHRISSVQDADHVICLDEGRIVEEGNHASLMARNGFYAELYEKQMMQEHELEK